MDSLRVRIGEPLDNVCFPGIFMSLMNGEENKEKKKPFQWFLIASYYIVRSIFQFFIYPSNFFVKT